MIADAIAIAAARLGDDAPAVLARLGNRLGEKANRSAPEVMAAVRRAVPLSCSTVHPTWIEHWLAALPARARTALTAATDAAIPIATKPTTSEDAVDVWLARWVTALAPPLAARRDALTWLARIGAEQMAFALGEQARAVPALVDAARRIEQPPRAGQLGPQRAAIARCRDVSLDDDLAFVRVAARALAPHLAADQVARLQLLLGLPRPISIVVARELALHASTPLEQCPAWAALAG